MLRPWQWIGTLLSKTMLAVATPLDEGKNIWTDDDANGPLDRVLARRVERTAPKDLVLITGGWVTNPSLRAHLGVNSRC
jgi:hypothetical protein